MSTTNTYLRSNPTLILKYTVPGNTLSGASGYGITRGRIAFILSSNALYRASLSLCCRMRLCVSLSFSLFSLSAQGTFAIASSNCDTSLPPDSLKSSSDCALLCLFPPPAPVSAGAKVPCMCHPPPIHRRKYKHDPSTSDDHPHMSSSACSKLPAFLRRLVDSDRYGGRTICTDEHTVVLYDCGQWSDTHSNVLQQWFPECSASVLPSDVSLSGFIVVIKIHRDSAVYWWTAATLLVALLVFVTTRQILKHT